MNGQKKVTKYWNANQHSILSYPSYDRHVNGSEALHVQFNDRRPLHIFTIT